MPRGSRLRDYLMRRDGRNRYGSAGGYVSSRRVRDRGMEDMARGRNDYAEHRGRMDYGYHTEHRYPMGDMGYEQYGQPRYDGHYPMSEGKTYYPIEAMGTFNGYWGTPQQDYARGDYNYDMRGRYDYGYDYAGDYGENLTKEELEHWKKKLMQEVDEKDKQFFNKETFSQRVKSMGMPVGDKFSEEELCLTTLMMLTDYKNTLGTSNMDLYVRLAKDWLEDKDVAVKGGEKLAIYHDEIVMGDMN